MTAIFISYALVINLVLFDGKAKKCKGKGNGAVLMEALKQVQGDAIALQSANGCGVLLCKARLCGSGYTATAMRCLEPSF